MNKRTALFIDAENISPSFATKILSRARSGGELFLRRAYGDVAKIKGWGEHPAIRLIHSGCGKNAGDLLLSLDALEIALADQAERFVIASSDGDFTHLATRFRDKGKEVIGIGEGKTPPTFREACSIFHSLEAPATKPPVKAATKTAAQPSKPTAPQPAKALSLDHKIRSTIAQHSKAGHGMLITHLSAAMKNAHGVKISELPEKRWRSYLAGRPALYDLDPKGPEALVRFRPEGFASA